MELESRFTYHAPPDQETVGAYVRIRAEAKMLAESIVELAPESREQSLAVTKIEEAVMWANAGIARNGLKPIPADEA